MNLNPIDQLDPVVILVTAVVFVLTLFALRKVFVLPYLAVMDARERLFDDTDERAAETERALASARIESEQSVATATAEAAQLLTDARDRADAYRRERLDTATRAASQRLERGRAEIAEARANELAQVRQQAVDCVGIACTHLLGESDTKAVETAVDRLMARRMH